MSLAILFRPVKTSAIGSMVLDATMSEEHTMESDITEFPVEDGVNISDHIWPKPRRFKIEGFITNSPVLILGTAGAAVVNAVVNDGKLASGPAINFVEAGFKALEELHKRRQLITITSRLKTYTNMGIESIVIPRKPTTGDALEFTMMVKEVRKVSSQFVMIQVKKPKNPKANPKANKGPQAPAAASASATQDVSLLKKIAGGLGTLFSGGL